MLALAAPLLTVWFLACRHKVLKKRVHLWVPHPTSCKVAGGLGPTSAKGEWFKARNNNSVMLKLWICCSAHWGWLSVQCSMPAVLSSGWDDIMVCVCLLAELCVSEKNKSVWEGMHLNHISVAVPFADANTERLVRPHSVWHSGHEIWMKGRRDKSLIYCLGIWATDVKMLVILLPMWLYSHSDLLKFHIHTAEGTRTSKIQVFVFFFSEWVKTKGLNSDTLGCRCITLIKFYYQVWR